MKASVEYEWEPDREDGLSFVFAIEANVSKYVPASMYGGRDHLGWPAEGGEVEDMHAELTAIHGIDGNELSGLPNAAQIEAEFSAELARNHAMRENIETALTEDAAARSEPPDREDY